jgi:predicted sulfurtransferase
VKSSIAAPAEGNEMNDTTESNAPRVKGAQRDALIARTDVLFLDVRRPDEIEESGTVRGYLNIPIEELAERLHEIPRTARILTA